MRAHSSSKISLQLLGAVAVRRPGGGPGESLLTQPVRVALLSYLVLARPRGLQARDTIVGLFWPERDQSGARRALRNALYGIRQALGDDVLVTAGDSLVGVDPSRLECDVLTLEAELADGRLGTAATLPERELLQGFHLGDAPEFERWLDAERHRLRSRAADAAATIAKDCRMRGDTDGAVQGARTAYAIEPHNERMVRALMEALSAAGDRTGALREYDAFRMRLTSEYDSEPSAETRRLASQLRAHAPPAHDANGAAYVHHVRATYLFLRAAHGGHADDLHRSRAFFEQALALDPSFAPALAGLSNYFASAAARNFLRPFHANFAHALDLSRRALKLDPTLAVPHVTFGVKAMYFDDDWPTAGREFAEAVVLDPMYTEARRFRAIQLGATGSPADAVRELREAVRLEPQIAINRNSLADALMAAGEIEAAIVELRAALDADARYAAARERLVRCYERLGRYEEAIAERRFIGGSARPEEFERAFDASGEAGYREQRARELRVSMERAEAVLRNGAGDNAGDLFIPPQLRLALACAELEDWAGARRWEEDACKERPGRRPWFSSRPELQRPPG